MDPFTHPALAGGCGVLVMVGLFYLIILLVPWIGPAGGAADEYPEGETGRDAE